MARDGPNTWLNLFVPVNTTGYGTHGYFWSRMMAHQLTPYGIDVCVIPKGGRAQRPELEVQGITGLDGVLLDSIALQDQIRFDVPGICLWHPFDMAQFCGEPRIGYTVWETTKLTDREARHLSQLDYVAVPSEWHKQILDKQLGIAPTIFVWPEGVDENYYFPQEGKGPLEMDGFTFLNIGKWEVRKGVKVLAMAYGQLARKFEGHLNLIGCWGNPWMNPRDWLGDIQQAFSAAGFGRVRPGQSMHGNCYEMVSSANPKAIVKFYDTLPRGDQVRDLYRSADAGVFPYFAEGWGLSVMEMMAMGKPVAATQWGAPCQYLGSSGTHYPISEGQEAQAYDGKWFRGNKGNWFQVSAEGLLKVMEKMIWESHLDVGTAGAEHVRTNFSWKESTWKAIQDLKSLGLVVDDRQG